MNYTTTCAKEMASCTSSQKGPSTSRAFDEGPSTSKAFDESPSTSKDSNEDNMEVVCSNELRDVNSKLKGILDNCFKEKPQVVVNRFVLEELVSQTLECYCNEHECRTETKFWTEKYRLLQSQQIRMNKICYALKKQVENAKCIIRKLIDDRAVLNKRPQQKKINPILLKKKYRSVGLQVCTVGPLSVGNNAPKSSNSAKITSQNLKESGEIVFGIDQSDLRSTLLESLEANNRNSDVRSVERHSIGKEKWSQEKEGKISVNKANTTPTKKKSVSVKKENTNSEKEENMSFNKTNTTSTQKGSVSGNKANSTCTEKESVSVNETHTASTKKESVSVNKANTTSTKKESLSVNKDNMVITKESISVEKRNTVVPKTESVAVIKKSNLTKEEGGNKININKEEVNVKEIKKVIPSENNSSQSFKEVTVNEKVVHIKEEMINETYNEDYDIKSKTVTKKKCELVQDKVIHTNKRCHSESNNEQKGTNNKTSFNIRIRSPEYINRHFSKKAKISVAEESSTEAEPEPGSSTSFSTLPQYPLPPKYPPNIVRPPAPILQIGQKPSNCKADGIMLTWSFTCNKKPENIEEYQLYSYQENNNMADISKIECWKKVGDIKAIPLPIGCFLTQFIKGEKYYFIVRAVDNQNRLGDFSIPVSIVT